MCSLIHQDRVIESGYFVSSGLGYREWVLRSVVSLTFLASGY